MRSPGARSGVVRELRSPGTRPLSPTATLSANFPPVRRRGAVASISPTYSRDRAPARSAVGIFRRSAMPARLYAFTLTGTPLLADSQAASVSWMTRRPHMPGDSTSAFPRIASTKLRSGFP